MLSSLLRTIEHTTGQDEPVFGFTTVRIVGPSMAPALRNGEVYLARRGARVGVGDVIVLRHPQRPDLLTVKWVVRGEPGGLWVEGDNPGASSDSREFGLVPPTAVVGRIVVRLAPLRRRPAPSID